MNSPLWAGQAPLAEPGDLTSEPNNSASTATKLTATGLSTGWEICYPGDVDQFKIAVANGLTVRVIFTHGKGDLDAALVAPDGKITPGRSETDDELLSATNNGGHASSIFVLGVWGHNLATNTYALDITIQ